MMRRKFESSEEDKMSSSSKKEFAGDEPPKSGVKPELRMVLLGKSGVGKSASANTILGEKNLFKSAAAFSAVTVGCQKETRTIGEQSVVVVDTPGLCQSDREEEVVTEIKRSISLAHPGPHVFLIVLNLEPYTEEEITMMELIRSTFGKHTMKFTMVLFTHGSRLEGRTIEDFVGTNNDLSKLLSECKLGHYVFENDPNQADQATTLLRRIGGMVQAAGGDHYTTKMLLEQQEAEIKKGKMEIAKEKEARIKADAKKILAITTFSGLGIGCLIGNLVSGGVVMPVVGAAAGLVLGLSVGFLVVRTKKYCSK